MMLCCAQAVSVVEHIQLLLCSLLCHAACRWWMFLYACNGYCAHHYVVLYAGCECLCNSIVAMFTVMSCHTQEVSVLVFIQLLLCSLPCRHTQGVSVLLHIQSLLYSMLCRGAHSMWVFLYTIQLLWCSPLSCRIQAVSVLFLYAFNRCYAHCYVVSYAERKCSQYTHSIVAMLTAMSSAPGCECSCMHWIIAMLTAMSCHMQAVSILFLYACNGYCAHRYIMPYAVRECLCTHLIVAMLTVMSCRRSV